MRRLVGRCAVVTGAARGIGRAIVQRLSAEGAAVVGIEVSRQGRVAQLDELLAGRGD